MSNSTKASYYSQDAGTQAVAFGVLLAGCVCFGTMFLPLKRYNCGDGFFVQFIECATVFVFGCVINCIRRLPKLHLIAAIGGALYATGNCASVPIIKSELGIGIGMLLWSTVQIVEGWCIGRFGLLGTHVQKVKSEPLNIIGLILSIAAGFFFVFVRSEEERKKDEQEDGRRADTRGISAYFSKSKLFFIGLSIFLGLMHGLMLTPVVYVQENDSSYSGAAIDLIFSFMCGTFLFSTICFVGYAILKRGNPYVRAELVLPSVLYGILWSAGMTCFIVANSILSQTISWPITARLPPLIGCLLDVFVFKVIKGKRNFIILGTGVFICVVGVIMVGVSNR